MKSSLSIWDLLHYTVKISSICVAFLENTNFKRNKKYANLEINSSVF